MWYNGKIKCFKLFLEKLFVLTTLLSRHSPIKLKVALGDIPARKIKGVRRPAWYKAEQEHKEQYTMELNSRLCELVQPDSLLCSDPLCQAGDHTRERDNFVLDIMSTVIDVSHSTIPMVGGGVKGQVEDPSKSCPISKSVPGWQDEAEPYKKDAVFCIQYGRCWETK